MDYEDSTNALFLSSVEGLFSTVDEGVTLAESTIEKLRSWIVKNKYSLEIIFYVCDEPAEKKKTKDVAPHFHILLLANLAENVVSAIEDFIGNKINKDCYLYAKEIYALDALLRYIKPQCKKIRSLTYDQKGLHYFEAANAKRSDHKMIEDDIRRFTSKSLTTEVSEERVIEITTVWEAMLRNGKDKSWDADLSWLDA